LALSSDNFLNVFQVFNVFFGDFDILQTDFTHELCKAIELLFGFFPFTFPFTSRPGCLANQDICR
jgi:hypothetical protein